MSGNQDALLKLQDSCVMGLQDMSSVSAAYDICLYNLRPELHPKLSSLDPLGSVEQVEWLTKVLCCFRAMWFAPCPWGIGGSPSARGLPPALAKKIASKLDSHFIPSFLFVVDGYILDELQPDLPDLKHLSLPKAIAFISAILLLETLTSGSRRHFASRENAAKREAWQVYGKAFFGSLSHSRTQRLRIRGDAKNI